MTITADVVGPKGTIETSETFYAFVEDDDVKIDAHGVILNSSESITRDNYPKISLIDAKYELNILYDVIDISYALSSYEQAKSMAFSILEIPTLTINNPLPYLFYLARLELTKQHYLHNIGLNNEPTTYINDQSDYETWEDFQFGFHKHELFGTIEKCNICEKGCGIIAAFNALIEIRDTYGKIDTPNFSSLIALYELCGSDLMLGYFGVNPVEDWITSYLASCAKSVILETYYSVLLPVLEIAIGLIEPMLLALCVWTPLDLLVPGISISAAVTAMTFLNGLLLDAGRMVAEFIDWYGHYLCSETDMLNIIFGEKHITSHMIGTWNSFVNDFKTKRQAIICYSNDYSISGNGVEIMDIISKGAHYVYISKSSNDVGKVNVYNNDFYTGNMKTYSLSTMTDIMKPSDKDHGSSSQFIWGYVFK